MSDRILCDGEIVRPDAPASHEARYLIWFVFAVAFFVGFLAGIYL